MRIPLALLALLSTAVAAEKPARNASLSDAARPKLLFILADDLSRPIQYGLGWLNSATDKKVTPHMGAKSFGHGGAFGTHGWIDPEKKRITVFMIQNVLVPNCATSSANSPWVR